MAGTHTLRSANVVIVFILPFFIINCLKLRKRQKVALCGIFSLGLITIVISVARFLVYTVSDYTVDDASGSKPTLPHLIHKQLATNSTVDLWCTAEMCIATIVVSLPSLKALIMRKTPDNTNRSASGYVHSGPSGPRRSFSHHDTYRSHVRGGKSDGDDEIELVFQGSRKSSTSPMRNMSRTQVQDDKDAVRVTTDVTVVRDVL
jgi:hypothetical protein